MKVTVSYWYGSGDEFVDEDESEQMVIKDFEVNGRCIPAELAELSNFGHFLNLSLRLSLPAEETSSYLLKGLAEILELQEEVGMNFVDEIIIEGKTTTMTTDGILVLPVSSIEWVEMQRII